MAEQRRHTDTMITVGIPIIFLLLTALGAIGMFDFNNVETKVDKLFGITTDIKISSESRFTRLETEMGDIRGHFGGTQIVTVDPK